MIITLKGADFSASNIGTLSTWRITRSLGSGTTYEGPTLVSKGGSVLAYVVINELYELAESGVEITMGNEVISTYTIEGNVITISIAEVTGNVVIKVPTTKITVEEPEPEPEIPDTPDEPEIPVEPTYYTITYNYVNDSGVTIRTSTTESVVSGTQMIFSTTMAPTMGGYTISSVSPTNAIITNNITVTYIYTVSSDSGDSADRVEYVLLSGYAMTRVGTAYQNQCKKEPVNKGHECIGFNCSPNTQYTVTDLGTHNRFRFYGSTEAIDYTNIQDVYSISTVIYEGNETETSYSFNSGSSNSIFIYLNGGDSTKVSNIVITEG